MKSRLLRNGSVWILALIFVLLLTPSALACDTWVALGDSTVDGSVMLGKNSNRLMDEAQPIIVSVGQEHEPGTMVSVTHMEIPQAEVTYTVIGHSPWWMWGIEMGMNEHGVAIGNELVVSKDPAYPIEESLTGMDLQRLALERGRTAYEAMHVIIELMEEYGQHGSGAYMDIWPYWNSFIIADPNEAWVLETSDYRWVAKRIESGVYSISNTLTIGSEFDEASDDLIEYAIEQGWYDGEEPFNFKKVYTDWDHGIDPAGSINREQRSTQLLKSRQGEITVGYMIDVASDHWEGTVLESSFGPVDVLHSAICRHSRTFVVPGTMVAHLRQDERLPEEVRYVYWASQGSPCVSVLHPLYPQAPVPKELEIATNVYDENSPWWTFALLERLMYARNSEINHALAKAVFDPLQINYFETATMIEKEVSRLLEQGMKQEAMDLLGGFMKDNLSNSLEIAKQVAEIMRSIDEVVPTVKPLKPRNQGWIDAMELTLY